MTRKKQQKNKKQNPGVFISNLLNGGRSSSERKETSDTTEATKDFDSLNEHKNSLAKFQSVVLCRTVLELALVNIALSPSHKISAKYKNMAPSPPSSSTSSGLSKLMSPVQDLGKSLLGFLLGSPASNNQQQTQEPLPSSRRTSYQQQTQEPFPPSRRTSTIVQTGDTLERKRDSLTLPTSPGRQRPPGHPANPNPSINSTPVVIRRNKVDRSHTMSKSLESTNTISTSIKNSTVQEEPEPCIEASSSKSQPVVAAKPRSQSRSSRRRKAKRAAQQQCHQKHQDGNHDESQDNEDHETGNRKVSLSLKDSQVSSAQCDNAISHEADAAEHEQLNSVANDQAKVDTGLSHEDANITSDKQDQEQSSNIVLKRNNHCSNIKTEDEFVSARNSLSVESEKLVSSISSPEVGQGQENCHSEETKEEEIKEITRKDLFDIQDKVDKDNREVVEESSDDHAIAASDTTAAAASTEDQLVTNTETSRTASGPPPPPPLPPPGFLLEGLKLDKVDTVKQEEKFIAPKSTGTLRKNKQLSRKDLLITQLTDKDDSFALFLKTQLNIAVDARERSGTDSLSQTETLGRKKKERRKRTESECSNHDSVVSTDAVAEKNNECVVKPTTNESNDNSAATIVDSKSLPCEVSEKSKLRSNEIRDKNKKCASNARDRPISIIDIEEGTISNKDTTKADTVIEESDTTSVDKLSETSQNVDNNVISEPEVLEKAEKIEKPCEDLTDIVESEAGVEKPVSQSDMIVDIVDSNRLVENIRVDSTIPTTNTAMGAVQSHEFVSKQHLSKSDSGYSGQEDIEDDTETDGDNGEVTPSKSELTVDQALLKYDRIVEQKSVSETKSKPRTRVMSEGSEFSDDLTESENEDDDGVTRRPRENRSYNSRRSSTDSSEDGFNQNVRDLKQELKDMEEKFRKAMVANASLDNEKSQLMFQVDLLKDQVEEVEEQAALVLKELRAKSHDFELLKRDHAESVRAVQLLQQALTEQQAMLQERGLVLMGEDENEDAECDEMEQERRTRAIVSQETANILAGLGSGPLDVRIKRLAGQRDDLQDTVRRLKLDLEEERSRASMARGAADMEEAERETKKLLEEYKFRISKSDQEIATLEANTARLESQVVRYKKASETAELNEENLKSDRRKMQRELRDSQTRNEELETQNKHLQARLDKLKTAKSNLLKEL